MIYRVRYQSMTTTYGPTFIEADSETDAKRKFAKGAFTSGEMALISAQPVSADEMIRALRDAE